MKNRIYIVITIVAIIAAMALQGVWFGRTYKLMSEQLQKDINEMFDATARREVTYRMKKMPEGTRYYPNYIENRTKLKVNEAEYDKTPLSSIIMSNHALSSEKLDAKPIRFETEFKTDNVMADKEYLQEAISTIG